MRDTPSTNLSIIKLDDSPGTSIASTMDHAFMLQTIIHLPGQAATISRVGPVTVPVTMTEA